MEQPLLQNTTSYTGLTRDAKATHDATLLTALLTHTVLSAHAVVAAEIFLHSGHSLERPHGGHVVLPAYEPHDADAGPAALEALRTPPPPTALGVGVQGMLYQRAAGRTFSLTRWHSLAQLAKDDESPHDERSALLARAFEQAAGVAFPGGLLILFSRTDAPEERDAPRNARFLLASAAACSAAVVAMRAVPPHHSHWHKVRGALRAVSTLEMSVDHSARSTGSLGVDGEAVAPRCGRSLGRHVAAYVSKWRGGGVPPPPPASWEEAAFVVASVALTGLVVGWVNSLLLERLQSPVLFAPLGALMTMHFAAPNSPLGQPRNVIASNLLGALTSLVCGALPLPRPVEAVMAPAIAIGAMVKLGVTHPPAGAVSLLVAMAPETYSWRWLVFPLLTGNLLCCLFAVILNNLSRRRQFPLWW